MIVRRTFARGSAAAAVLVAAALLQAQQSGMERFRFERRVAVTAPGPQRLAIDVPLLVGGAPFNVRASGPDHAVAEGGLSDLRFFDASGAPVEHLLLYAPDRQPTWAAGDLLPIARTEKTSGFEADFHAAETIDAIRVWGIPAPFLKRLTLEGSGDRARWTLLAAEGTLFDLPDEGLRQTEIAFVPGAYRYLRVTWDDKNSGRVGPPASVEARRAAGLTAPPTLAASAGVERRPSEPGRTRYRVRLPGPRLPIVALVLEIPGGHVFRQVAVFESRLSGAEAVPSQLGRATLKRVVHDGLSAGELRIPISPPHEAELELVIDNGNNPPLDVRGVTVRFAELPWIYLEPKGGPLVARYGDPLAQPPRYDLEAVRETVNVTGLPEAAWEAPRLMTAASSAPLPMAVPESGAPLDGAAFAYTRPIPDGPTGLFALRLDAAAVTHSRGPDSRFADVRIIDGSRRQVPYLIERSDEPLVLDLSLRPARATAPELRAQPGRNRSIYAVTLPYANLPGARIVLETPGRVFQRAVQLGVERPPDRRRRDHWFDLIASGVWAHADQQTPAPALTLPVRQMSDTELLLVVDEGDNSALPIGAARLLLPSYRLRFYRAAAATSLQLAYGRDDLGAPRYDIALLAPQVMGAQATEVLPGPEAGRGTAPRAALITPRAFSVLLVLAVLVLVGVIVRLVRGTS